LDVLLLEVEVPFAFTGVYLRVSKMFSVRRFFFLPRNYFQLHEDKNVLDTMALGEGQYPD